jgi:5'-3' exonuclease
MILIDMNQVLISTLLSQLSYDKNLEVNEDLIRHMVLNTLLQYKKKFSHEYGEMILCADDKNYWRKKIFPFYKSTRKKRREDSPHDWDVIFTCLNKIRDEIKEYFPYRLIQVQSAEADDVIATLCKYSQKNYTSKDLLETPKPVLIVSSDKDFLQLQKFSNVKQYSPNAKKLIFCDDPEQYLYEHIVSGDSGDGIPNVLSDDDALHNPDKKQNKLTQKRLGIIYESFKVNFQDNEDLAKKFKRNKEIIDLINVPNDIENEIINTFENGAKSKDKSKLMKYFVQNKLKLLFHNLDEF